MLVQAQKIHLQILTLVLVVLVFGAGGATGHEWTAETAEGESQPGIAEKLGQQAAVDAVFRDEEGVEHRLGDLLTLPTLILPVYFSCPDVCGFLQGNIARVLPEMTLAPGRDFQVLSISFDDTDTPEAAKRSRNNYLGATADRLPPAAWKFLTGEPEDIERFMGSLGFQFQRRKDGFLHPVAVVALAPGGKIVRYLYGVDFMPFDLTMAMSEAAKGVPGLSLKRVLAFCFSYDPAGRRYMLHIMRVSGAVIVTLVLILLGALVSAGRRRPRRTTPPLP